MAMSSLSQLIGVCFASLVLSACSNISNKASTDSGYMGLDSSFAFISCHDKYLLPNLCWDYAQETGGKISFYQWLRNTDQDALAEYVRDYKPIEIPSTLPEVEATSPAVTKQPIATQKKPKKVTYLFDSNGNTQSIEYEPVDDITPTEQENIDEEISENFTLIDDL